MSQEALLARNAIGGLQTLQSGLPSRRPPGTLSGAKRGEL
jgi:hypothetical protein